MNKINVFLSKAFSLMFGMKWLSRLILSGLVFLAIITSVINAPDYAFETKTVHEGNCSILNSKSENDEDGIYWTFTRQCGSYTDNIKLAEENSWAYFAVENGAILNCTVTHREDKEPEFNCSVSKGK